MLLRTETPTMFGWFRKSSPIEAMKKRHRQLEEQAFALSRTDRKASDALTAEAEALWKEIEVLMEQERNGGDPR